MNKPRSKRGNSTNARKQAESIKNGVEQDDGSFEVDQVLSKQVDVLGKFSYLIKWRNWDGPPNWEPEENCTTCTDKIQQFHQKVYKARKHLSNSKFGADSETEIDEMCLLDIDFSDRGSKSKSPAHSKSFRSRNRSAVELGERRGPRRSRI